MPTKEGELVVPPKAEAASDAFEIMRVWLLDSGPTISLLPNTWSDPGAWGLLLVDVAQHVASALSAGDKNKRREILDRIGKAIQAEWSHPTGDASGGFILED